MPLLCTYVASGNVVLHGPLTKMFRCHMLNLLKLCRLKYICSSNFSHACTNRTSNHGFGYPGVVGCRKCFVGETPTRNVEFTIRCLMQFILHYQPSRHIPIRWKQKRFPKMNLFVAVFKYLPPQCCLPVTLMLVCASSIL